MHMATRQSSRRPTSPLSSAPARRSHRGSPNLTQRQSPASDVVASIESQQPLQSSTDASVTQRQSPAVEGLESEGVGDTRGVTPSVGVTPTETAPAQVTGSRPGRTAWGVFAPKGPLKGQSKVEKASKPKRRPKRGLNAQELRCLERQEELRKHYQALAMMLRPCLDELAGRTLASLQQSRAAHQRSQYHALTRQELAARTKAAISALEREEKLVASNLATKLESGVCAAHAAYSVSGSFLGGKAAG